MTVDLHPLRERMCNKPACECCSAANSFIQELARKATEHQELQDAFDNLEELYCQALCELGELRKQVTA